MSIILAAAGAALAILRDLSNLATSYTDLDTLTGTYRVSVIFRMDSTVDVTRQFNADLNNEQDPYIDPLGGLSKTWVRCLHVSGDNMTGGDAVNTWHPLTSERVFTMQHTSSGGNDHISGFFDFELASDASGSNIQAQALNRNIQAGETA